MTGVLMSPLDSVVIRELVTLRNVRGSKGRLEPAVLLYTGDVSETVTCTAQCWH